jgi:uncharacterized membrane protein YfcA
MQEKPDAKMKMVQGRYRTLLVIWIAILWSITIFVAVPGMVGVWSTPESNNHAFAVFAGLCLLIVAVSFVVKGILLARAEQQQNVALVMRAYIISFALCEASCLVGLLAAFTGISPSYYLLFIPGLVCMLLHMPRRERLLAAAYKDAR